MNDSDPDAFGDTETLVKGWLLLIFYTVFVFALCMCGAWAFRELFW